MVSVVWFRRDLRIDDHKALAKAIASQDELLCVFHFNPQQLSSKPSKNQQAFVTSVFHLQALLKEEGIDLYFMYGDLFSSFEALKVKLPSWDAVYFNYDESGFGRLRDQEAARFFRDNGITIHAYQDHYLHGSQEIRNQLGQPYKVFTPYYKRWIELAKETPISINMSQGRWYQLPQETSDLEQVAILQHQRDNALELTHAQAKNILADFVDNGLAEYHEKRDLPTIEGTSRLSPYLRCGLIGIRTVFNAVVRAPASQGKATFIKELAWRDFYNMIYVAYPTQKTQEINKSFNHVLWDNNPIWFEQWQKGETGYPLIDAAMIQLRQTGWMHNRLRMIVASFLTKDLLIDWRWGEAYFQEMLIDYDAASNIGGWQWAASTGTDAVPYFRIFNPVTQSKRFDPEGQFIKTYLPQLAKIPTKYIHEPWKMPRDLQVSLKISLGKDYPLPIVDHAERRQLALARYEASKEVWQESVLNKSS